MEILSDLQKAILKGLAVDPIFKDYYLTGGTALSAFYLKHRYSEDLDFFTEVPQGVARAESLIEKLAGSLKLSVAFGRRFKTLFECTVKNKSGDTVEMDFALDLPGRLQPVRPSEALGVDLDNVSDIACNKVSALYDRVEPKDFVDVYFLVREEINFEKLWALARKKYPGMDPYGLALAFFKVKGVEHLPRMVKPVSREELIAFFLEKAREITKTFEKPNR